MKILKFALMSMFLFSPLMGQVFQPLQPINASVSQASNEPTIVLEETDQTLPDGKWRFRLSGNILTIDLNTAVAGDFSTQIEMFEMTSTGRLDLTLDSSNFMILDFGGTIVGSTGGGIWINQATPSNLNHALRAVGTDRIDLNAVQTLRIEISGSTVASVSSIDNQWTFNRRLLFTVAAPATEGIILDSDDLVGDGQQDSHSILWTGLGFESATPHDIDWKAFVDVTADDGTGSIWTMQNRIDAASFANILTLTDADLLTLGTSAQESEISLSGTSLTGFIKTAGFNFNIGHSVTAVTNLLTNDLIRLSIQGSNEGGATNVVYDLRVNGADSPFVGASLNVKSATDNFSTASGSSVTSVGLIPAGSFVVGVVTRVTTTVTGPTGFDIGDGVDVDRWGNSIAVASGTTSDLTDATAQAHDSFSAANDVVITSDGVDFTGGVIEVIVYYLDLTAPTS